MEDNAKKFNIIDVILITLAALAVLTVAAKFIYPDFFRTKPETVTVSCTLKTSKELSPYIESLTSGEKLYIDTDVAFGTVTEVQCAETEAADGEAPIVSYQVNMICYFTYSDGRFSASNGHIIVTGDELTLNSKDTLYRVSVENLLKTDGGAKIS